MGMEKIQSVEKVEANGIWESIRDSRIVAMRWDLVPWSLVLDIDSHIAEPNVSDMKRLWLVFHNISNIELPLVGANVPTGIWINSQLWSTQTGVKHGFANFSFTIAFAGSTPTEGTRNVKQMVEVVAEKVSGIISIGSCNRGDTGLSFAERNQLATDNDFLNFIGND